MKPQKLFFLHLQDSANNEPIVAVAELLGTFRGFVSESKSTKQFMMGFSLYRISPILYCRVVPALLLLSLLIYKGFLLLAAFLDIVVVKPGAGKTARESFLTSIWVKAKSARDNATYP